MTVDRNLIISLVEAAMTADYTRVRRLGNHLAKYFADNGDLESAVAVRTILRKRGVPLQTSGFTEALPRDAASRLPLVEEGQWPTTPAFINDYASHVFDQFMEDASNIGLLADSGVASRLALLLYGPPGTGKSLLAGHVAANLGRPLYVARLDSLISSRLGETAKNIRGIFDFVPAKNAVLFLDEMDAVAKLRDDKHELGELKRVVNTVLQGLDALSDDVVTIGATNHPHLLDPAIWRRFPYKIELKLPDQGVRAAMWSHFLFNEDESRGWEADILSRVSTDLSGADIENLALAARRRAILGKKEPSLAHIVLAARRSRAGSPRMLDDRELTTDDKRTLTKVLAEQGQVPLTDISKIVGVSRQMIHRYLKEAEEHG